MSFLPILNNLHNFVQLLDIPLRLHLPKSVVQGDWVDAMLPAYLFCWPLVLKLRLLLEVPAVSCRVPSSSCAPLLLYKREGLHCVLGHRLRLLARVLTHE